MSDGVKYIFKTLIKIPIIVCVVYALFNMFAFSFCYFRLLGYSYVVMHTAVENNYLPTSELGILTGSLNEMETSLFKNFSISCDTDVTGDPDSDASYTNTKVQYGTKIRVKVTGHYTFLWPLMSPAGEVAGMTENYGHWEGDPRGQMTPGGDTVEKTAMSEVPITFVYTIPGLKYYPDLQ